MLSSRLTKNRVTLYGNYVRQYGLEDCLLRTRKIITTRTKIQIYFGFKRLRQKEINRIAKMVRIKS